MAASSNAANREKLTAVWCSRNWTSSCCSEIEARGGGESRSEVPAVGFVEDVEVLKSGGANASGQRSQDEQGIRDGGLRTRAAG